MNRTNEEEMKDKRIVVNSVVQVNENGQEKWIGCFVQVSEVKNWGVQGWTQIPMQGSAYIRLKWEQMDYIGKAVLVPRIVRFTFDWDGYEGVDDELLIEDLGFRIEDGVTWEILKNDQPYTAEDIQSFYIWANANGFYYGELTGVWYNDETEDEVYAIEEVLTKWEEETK